MSALDYVIIAGATFAAAMVASVFLTSYESRHYHTTRTDDDAKHRRREDDEPTH